MKHRGYFHALLTTFVHLGTPVPGSALVCHGLPWSALVGLDGMDGWMDGSLNTRLPGAPLCSANNILNLYDPPAVWVKVLR